MVKRRGNCSYDCDKDNYLAYQRIIEVFQVSVSLTKEADD